MNVRKPLSLHEIRKAGFKALTRELGVVNAVRFLQQFETGSGDYTKERAEWLDDATVNQISQEIETYQHGRGEGE